MTIIVISHTSTFASYLIALSIFLYYQSRSRVIKIIIVEVKSNNLNKTNNDLKPWCGVNTLSHLRFENPEFMLKYILQQILLQPDFSVLRMNLINITKNENARITNMDLPPNSQTNVIQASLSDGLTNIVGLVYHPILLMNKLRHTLVNTNKVVFTSLGHRQSLEDIVRGIISMEPYQDVILLDYLTIKSTSMINFDFLIHSNLNNIQYLNLINLNKRPPSYMLWIPQFRAQFGPSTSNSLRYKVSRQPTPEKRFTKINIHPVEFNTLEEEVMLEIDLFYGLRLGDFTLKAVEEMVNMGKINLITHRL